MCRKRCLPRARQQSTAWGEAKLSRAAISRERVASERGDLSRRRAQESLATPRVAQAPADLVARDTVEPGVELPAGARRLEAPPAWAVAGPSHQEDLDL